MNKLIPSKSSNCIMSQKEKKNQTKIKKNNQEFLPSN